MKYFLLFSCFELLAYLLGFFGRSGKKINWMSREYTTALKGASMFIILWSHVGISYGVKHIQFIGTVGVSLFIIFSGYGIQRSTDSQGLKDYWKKRFVNIALPYWIMEAVGLYVTGQFTLKRYVLDFFFVKPAMGPGWFMQYIMICYIIFYLISVVFEKKHFDRNTLEREVAVYGAFIIWFVLDSLFFADPEMPFLKARQMLCFPFGISVAKHKEKIGTLFGKPVLILAGGFIGLSFMAITQLRAIKEASFLIQNLLSLPTVFPLALSVLVLTKRWKWLLDNKVLTIMGLISYEVYLVHIFTLELLRPSTAAVILFMIMTIAGACLLYLLRKKLKKVSLIFTFSHNRENAS